MFLLTLSKLKQEESAVKAIVLIQKHIRGTLARWNLRVLKLERKKEAVEALKQKQLKKLNQRSKQKMLAFRIVMEHEHQHRVKMRHLRRATILKELFKGQSTRAEQEQCDLYKQIQELTLKNEELEDSTKELEDQAKKLEPEVAALEATKEELKDICNDYKLAIEIWKGKMEQLFSSHSTEKRRYS
mgnify:CR=1 FL=1